MERYFAQFGLSGAQWGVLRTLHRAELAHSRALRLSELGEQMLVRPPTMTGVVDRLERTGHIRKRPSSSDRRAKEVSLTTQGRVLVRQILRHHSARIGDVVGDLSPSDARALLRLIDRLSRRLEDPAQPPTSSK